MDKEIIEQYKRTVGREHHPTDTTPESLDVLPWYVKMAFSLAGLLMGYLILLIFS